MDISSVALISFYINNTIMLRLYLISLTCFLVPICFVISTEVYKILSNYIFIKNTLLDTEDNIQSNNLLGFAKIYIKQKKWISCILLLEKNILKQDIFMSDYFNIMGFCYFCIKIYKLSEYYYCQAINKNSSNILALCNLANLYTLMNKYQDAIKLYEKVLILDITNITAKKQLKLLSRKI